MRRRVAVAVGALALIVSGCSPGEAHEAEQRVLLAAHQGGGSLTP